MLRLPGLDDQRQAYRDAVLTGVNRLCERPMEQPCRYRGAIVQARQTVPHGVGSLSNVGSPRLWWGRGRLDNIFVSDS